jgi:hypothetical protein
LVWRAHDHGTGLASIDRCGHFAERNRTIARQFARPFVAGVIADPVAHLAAGAQHSE